MLIFLGIVFNAVGAYLNIGNPNEIIHYMGLFNLFGVGFFISELINKIND